MQQNHEYGDLRTPKEDVFLAYGFDAAAFPVRHESMSLGQVGRVEFLDFYSPTHLDTADGVIIPQGIFEKIETQNAAFGRRTIVSVDKLMLLERERQVFNLLRAGKWICFLVGDIVDEVSQGLHLESINDTDLCKRILNSFMVARHHRYHLYIDTPPEVVVRELDFEPYVRNFGTPTTVFTMPHHHPIERTVIAELGDYPVGFEFDAQLFFLPFKPAKKNEQTETATIKAITKAIVGYRRRRIVEAPHWVDALRFTHEEKLYVEINSFLEKVNSLESELRSWKDYKTIVTTSGERLRYKIFTILESVFELHLNEISPLGIATVSDHGRQSVVMLETQSVTGTVEKSAIDQVDKHRKSAGLAQSTPAILFINSNISIEDIAKRAQAGVSDEVANYAKSLNVLILRTIDFLFLMRQLENYKEQGKMFLRLLHSRTGWLRVAPEGLRSPP